MFTKIGKEKGYPPVTRGGFEAQNSTTGSLLIGDPKKITDKILRHSRSLGGITRMTLPIDAISDHKK